MKEQLDWIPFYVSEIQRYSQYLSLENKGKLLDIICFVINADLDLNSDYKSTLKSYNLADDFLLEILDKFSFFKYLQNLIEKQKNKRDNLRKNSAKGGKSTKYKYKQKDSQMASQKDSLLNSSSSSSSNSNFKDIKVEQNLKKYFYEGRKIKLTEEDYSIWQKNYSNLNLKKELPPLDDFYYANDTKDWFVRCSAALANKNKEAKPIKQPTREYA